MCTISCRTPDICLCALRAWLCTVWSKSSSEPVASAAGLETVWHAHSHGARRRVVLPRFGRAEAVTVLSEANRLRQNYSRPSRALSWWTWVSAAPSDPVLYGDVSVADDVGRRSRSLRFYSHAASWIVHRRGTRRDHERQWREKLRVDLDIPILVMQSIQVPPRCKQKQRGLRGLLRRWPSITEWEMHITAQAPPSPKWPILRRVGR